MTKLVRSLLVLVTVACVSGAASAQDLTGLWFKLKVRTGGYAVNPGAETVVKAKVSLTAYLHLVAPFVDGGSLPATSYGYELWVEESPGAWMLWDSDNFEIEAGDGKALFATDVFLPFATPAGLETEGYFTSIIKVKTDGEGAVTGATWKSLGGEATDGTVDGDNRVRGSLSVAGKTVPAEQLPFDPGA